MRAADVAALQVEQIVAAAQAAAEEILEEGRREATRLREEGIAEVEKEMNRARKDAIMLTQEARKDAEGVLADAEEETTRLRHQTERAVQGRVASAEKAAADVLQEARTLSGGLQQLGRSLGSQADRILRDVSAAHKRMQADLRISSGADRVAERLTERGPGGAEPEASSAGEADPASAADGSDAEPERKRSRSDREQIPPRRRGANPFVDLDVPSWER